MASGDAYIYQTFTFKLDSNALKKTTTTTKTGQLCVIWMSLRPLINRKLHWAKIQNVPVEGERVTGKRCRGRMDSLCWLCVCVCVPARVCVCVCIFLPGCVWQEPGLIAVKAREWERRKKEADACVLAQKKIRPLSASHTHTHTHITAFAQSTEGAAHERVPVLSPW